MQLWPRVFVFMVPSAVLDNMSFGEAPSSIGKRREFNGEREVWLNQDWDAKDCMPFESRGTVLVAESEARVTVARVSVAESTV